MILKKNMKQGREYNSSNNGPSRTPIKQESWPTDQFDFEQFEFEQESE